MTWWAMVAAATVGVWVAVGVGVGVALLVGELFYPTRTKK